jgi:hypothetical protein
MSAPVQNTPNGSSNNSAVAAPSAGPAVSPIPCNEAIMMAARLAFAGKMPIQTDYYYPTATGQAFIGEDVETKERALVKNRDEFTSNIKKMGKAGDDVVIMTENSVYVISGKTVKRRVSMKELRAFEDEDSDEDEQ